MIPVTTNYDRKVAHRGYVDVKDGKIFVKLVEPVHEKDIFDVFGTIGFMAISYEMRDDGIYYKEFEIREFSYCVDKPVEPPNTVEYAWSYPRTHSPFAVFGAIILVSCALLAAFMTWGVYCGN